MLGQIPLIWEGYQLLFTRSIRIKRSSLARAMQNFFAVACDVIYLDQDMRKDRLKEQSFALGWAASEFADALDEDCEAEVPLSWPSSEGQAPKRLTSQARRAIFKELHANIVGPYISTGCAWTWSHRHIRQSQRINSQLGAGVRIIAPTS